MRVLLIIAEEVWILGTLARLLRLGVPHGVTVRAITDRDVIQDISGARDEFQRADVVHWLVHWTIRSQIEQCLDLIDVGSHVVTVHHVEEAQGNLNYLRYFRRVVIHAGCFRDDLRRLGVDPERIVHLPQAADDCFAWEGLRRLSLEANSASRRPSDKMFRVGFFATPYYKTDRKGIDLLPAVLRELLARGVPCELLVAGREWRATLKTPPFEGLPVLAVAAPSYFDMPALYSQLDAYLCLSRVEGGALPVFEAALCGVPVVTTDVGQVSEHLVSGKTCSLIPHEDTRAAAAALESVFRNSEAYRDGCREALERVRRAFSAAEYQRHFFELYASVLGISLPLDPKLDARGQERLRRQWRAWDRYYWSQRRRRMSRSQALRWKLEALVLDPSCQYLRCSIARKLGLTRSRLSPWLEGDKR